eukprot:3908004-Amphidinium_carterae.1
MCCDPYCCKKHLQGQGASSLGIQLRTQTLRIRVIPHMWGSPPADRPSTDKGASAYDQKVLQQTASFRCSQHSCKRRGLLARYHQDVMDKQPCSLTTSPPSSRCNMASLCQPAAPYVWQSLQALLCEHAFI